MQLKLILCFHYIGLLFGPFRNDPSYFAVKRKLKCCWIDPAISCLHLEWYDKMTKIVYYVIHINFSINLIDSCCMLRRGHNEICRKITKSSKNVRLEKNWSKKYSWWLTKIKMSRKSPPEFQCTDDYQVIQISNYSDCLLKRLFY